MPIKADYHLHTSYSGDATSSMEEMIQKGIQLGLTHMCFTDHYDYDFPHRDDIPDDYFIVNTDAYLYELLKMREKYGSQIKINFGIELGLQPHLKRHMAIYAKQYDFDFIIGSSHICNKQDPYYPEFYEGEGRTEEDAYREYFSSIIENIRLFSNFDVYGHLDYVVRYGPNKDQFYTYDKYKDLLDQIIDLLLEKGKGIEINTAAVKSGLRELHPCMAVLKRYHDMGGEIITVGSDAHNTARIAADFDRASDILKECGFKYYTIFENRIPEFKKL